MRSFDRPEEFLDYLKSGEVEDRALLDITTDPDGKIRVEIIPSPVKDRMTRIELNEMREEYELKLEKLGESEPDRGSPAHQAWEKEYDFCDEILGQIEEKLEELPETY